MGAAQNRYEAAGNGFERVHRVTQSPLGDLWLALDQRRGLPGTPLLLRYVSLSDGATKDVRERVASAGRAAMNVQSELLLPVVEVLDQGQLIVAYPYLEAQPLSVLQSTARARELFFPVGVALRLCIDLLRALQAVHASWLGWPTEAPYGGLLPASVLVSRDGRTRLCDALISSSALLQRGFDLSAAELAYRAPEQVYASVAPEPTTDVFTVAVLLWELLSGRRLLSGRKETIERKLLEHDLPRLSADERPGEQLPRGLLELVERGLALNPGQRPETPGAFAAALQRCGPEVASRAEVAAFVSELAGPQLDRLGTILKVALGYASDPNAAPAGIVAPSSPSAAPAPATAAPAPADDLAPRDAAVPRAAPPLPLPSLPPPYTAPAAAPRAPAAEPRSVAKRRSALAEALAQSFSRHRTHVAQPAVTGQERAGQERAGQAQTGHEQAPAQPLSSSYGGASPESDAAVESTTRRLIEVRRQQSAPPPAAVPSAAPAAAPAVSPRVAPEPSAPGRPSLPPLPLRPAPRQGLAPKRVLLAAMASVVLAVQLWMFSAARAQRHRDLELQSSEAQWRSGPRADSDSSETAPSRLEDTTPDPSSKPER